MALVNIPAEEKTLRHRAEITAFLAPHGIEYERWPDRLGLLRRPTPVTAKSRRSSASASCSPKPRETPVTTACSTGSAREDVFISRSSASTNRRSSSNPRGNSGVCSIRRASAAS